MTKPEPTLEIVLQMLGQIQGIIRRQQETIEIMKKE